VVLHRKLLNIPGTKGEVSSSRYMKLLLIKRDGEEFKKSGERRHPDLD
jgi:hypothetical protein